MSTDPRILNLLSRSIDNIVDKSHLENRLTNGGKLRVKLGIDPTSPNIHLGRSIPLLKLRAFQQLGHQIVLIIGDFTAVIGDTSDKASERPALSKETVEINAETYIKQFSKLVDISKAEIRYNSEWLNKVSYTELCEQAGNFSVNDFISRSNIKDRLDRGSRVSLREVLYPLMQGFDSVSVKADVELGGADQWFNLLAGRDMQKYYKQASQDILTTILINGLDGRKMSSSWGNTINLTDDADTMFGKVMSLSDELIIPYYTHCTEINVEKIETYAVALKNTEISPIDLKSMLALEITRMYCGKEQAKNAAETFVSVIRNKEVPTDIIIHKVTHNSILNVLVETKIAKSRSDARRLIEQKGIKINKIICENTDKTVSTNDIIQKGNRTFVKVDLE
jgi:tyrosyl-tRNA synthetase